MPRFLEKKLRAEASKHGFSGRQADRYVYGGLNNIGAMHGNQETAKGARMDAKHARDVKAGTAEGMRYSTQKHHQSFLPGQGRKRRS